MSVEYTLLWILFGLALVGWPVAVVLSLLNFRRLRKIERMMRSSTDA